MNVYIDKENFISLINSKDDVNYSLCLELLKSDLDIYFNFSKDEIANNEEYKAWFNFIASQGVVKSKIKFNCNFPLRPLKSNTTIDFEFLHFFSVFLLDDDDISKFESIGSVYVGSVGNELNTLMKLYYHDGKKHKLIRELRMYGREFNKWEDLEPFVSPLTDILIIDPYILKNTEPSPETITYNLVKFLDVLVKKTNYKVNIVIVFNPSELSYDLTVVKKKINDTIEKSIGKKPNITFVKTHKEHDRTIITNYTRITGNSFNYWDVNGNPINKGKEIVIRSLVDFESHENAILAINDIQNLIGNDNVEGAKSSNFLKFP